VPPSWGPDQNPLTGARTTPWSRCGRVAPADLSGFVLFGVVAGVWRGSSGPQLAFYNWFAGTPGPAVNGPHHAGGRDLPRHHRAQLARKR